MTTTITPPAHLEKIYCLLTATYGEPELIPDNDALGGLVGTILSQHTSDINSERAYQQLIATFPTWEEVRDAPISQVAEAIRSGGLANIKALRIQDVLHTLTENQQEAEQSGSLAAYLYNKLTSCSPEDAWHYLRSLPGVGPKTAACVLMFDLGLPVMPVDTHVWRVSRRLGLIGPKVRVDQAHEIFARITPAEWIYTLHVNLIRHGRQICHAQRPACARCTLYRECAYVGSVNPQETAISN
jgi:endonuclease-3